MSPTDWLVSALACVPLAPPKQRYTYRVRKRGQLPSAAKAKQWREHTIRPAWLAYCAAHRERWPGLQPMGFGRFMHDGHYRTWRTAPHALLDAPNGRNHDTAQQARRRAQASIFNRNV
jgi:hypothetical protein